MAAGEFPESGRDHREHDLRRVVSRAGRPLHRHRRLLRDGRRQSAAACLERRRRRGERPLRVQHRRRRSRTTPGTPRTTGSTSSSRPRRRPTRRRRRSPSRFPAAAATNVDPATPVTATFSEAMDAATISSSTFELRNPSNNARQRDRHLQRDDQDRHASIRRAASRCRRPTRRSSRAARTDPRVKDAAGNAMAANATWTFTTAAGAAAAAGLPVLDLGADRRAGSGRRRRSRADRPGHEVPIRHRRVHHRRALLQGAR